MAGPGVIERPKTTEAPAETNETSTQGGADWIVTVYDNDTNTVDEVVWILIIATKCDEEEAMMETWEVHHLGRSVVHHASEEECRKVANVISTIGIKVEATPQP